jgi:hypothetical protein
VYHQRENERERGGSSLATSFSSGGGKQRWRRWWVWCSGAGERERAGAKGKERGRRLGFIWTERGKGKWKGVAAGGLAIDGRQVKRRKEQEEGKTADVVFLVSFTSY